MEVEYQLLEDVVAKPILAKKGSFDAFTSKKFSVIIAIATGLKINWAVIQFWTLKEMVT